MLVVIWRIQLVIITIRVHAYNVWYTRCISLLHILALAVIISTYTHYTCDTIIISTGYFRWKYKIRSEKLRERRWMKKLPLHKSSG